MNAADQREAAELIGQQLQAATQAAKCHPCACFHSTVRGLAASPLAERLNTALAQAEAVLEAEAYECLGCSVCYPAIASNALADSFPELGAAGQHCPTDTPSERRGWPPLPGDYRVVRYRAPVAVCALNTQALVEALSGDGLALVGTLRTENLGIERLIRNVLGNPHIRFLIVCGEETQQAVGHLPGQSLVALFEQGIDAQGRIRAAKGRRPVLKNLAAAQVELFRRQVALVDRIGVTDPAALRQAIAACAERAPGPFEAGGQAFDLPLLRAREPSRLVLDERGYFIVYPDRARGMLTLEHYHNSGVLNCIIEGPTSTALCATAIERELLTRLDHAAYLGRELGRAEQAMRSGEPYVQDRAPGELAAPAQAACGAGCGCAPTPERKALP